MVSGLSSAAVNRSKAGIRRRARQETAPTFDPTDLWLASAALLNIGFSSRSWLERAARRPATQRRPLEAGCGLRIAKQIAHKGHH
jgi:hypothetical protein